MADKRDAFAKNLSVEILDKIVDEYGFRTDFTSVATTLITDLLGFVMCNRLESSCWDRYCELISTEAKARAKRVRDFETGIKQ